MRLQNILLLLVLLTACGRSDTTAEDSASSSQKAVDQALEAETTSAPVELDSPCSLLEPIVSELFIPSDTEPSVREATHSNNHLCTISWDIPGLDPQEIARRVLSKDKSLRYNNEVSLTIMGTNYRSAEEAVASLESAVASLSQGVTVNAGGRERTVTTEFGDWIEGLGDLAIWKGKSILVAADGARFTIAASLSDDQAENQNIVLELARLIIERI